MKKFAVIVAGGSGQRMQSATPKQFLLLNDKPVLQYSLEAFLKAFNDIKIVVVVPKNFLEQAVALMQSVTDDALKIKVVEGGETRFNSVKNGLQYIEENAVVFVHDAVRCLITQEVIMRCYDAAIAKGSAVPAVASIDSVRIVDGEKNIVANRTLVRMIQTPQTFLTDIILPAFKQDYNDAFTDEATVVEAFGKEVHLVEGDYNNIKITRPVDMLLAQQILKERSTL